MPGGQPEQLANMRALLGFMWAHPGKQLLFMGSEFAQPEEWNESASLNWDLPQWPDHSGMQAMVRDLNRVYKTERALWSQDVTPEGFQWIDANDAVSNVLSFLRWGDDGSVLACVSNFSGSPHVGYRLGLARAGRWREALNTDAGLYAGTGAGNYGAVEATEQPWHGLPASAEVYLPALSTVWFVAEQ
jgi:1,4-alpha-glucan branching enzyme